MKDIDRDGIAKVMERALAIAGTDTRGIHVSFDLDVCDPSIAPGVGTPVKGGLNYREAHMVMEMVADSGRLLAPRPRRNQSDPRLAEPDRDSRRPSWRVGARDAHPLTKRSSSKIVAAIRAGKDSGIRAGTRHRFIGIRVVEVGGRVFVRSWTMKPDGWYHALLKNPRGELRVGERTVRMRARAVRSDRIKTAVSAAYFEKEHNTPSSLIYCRGFARGRRRDTTTDTGAALGALRRQRPTEN